MFDKELQLICWNRQFGEILDVPPSLNRVGIGLADILRFNGNRGDIAPDRGVEEFVRMQIERISRAMNRSSNASPRAW